MTRRTRRRAAIPGCGATIRCFWAESRLPEPESWHHSPRRRRCRVGSPRRSSLPVRGSGKAVVRRIGVRRDCEIGRPAPRYPPQSSSRPWCDLYSLWTPANFSESLPALSGMRCVNCECGGSQRASPDLRHEVTQPHPSGKTYGKDRGDCQTVLRKHWMTKVFCDCIKVQYEQQGFSQHSHDGRRDKGIPRDEYQVRCNVKCSANRCRPKKYLFLVRRQQQRVQGMTHESRNRRPYQQLQCDCRTSIVPSQNEQYGRYGKTCGQQHGHAGGQKEILHCT